MSKVEDSNVEDVIAHMRERSIEAKKEYGVTTERDDMTLEQWIDHTQEELCDAAIYLEKIKKIVHAMKTGAFV